MCIPTAKAVGYGGIFPLRKCCDVYVLKPVHGESRYEGDESRYIVNVPPPDVCSFKGQMENDHFFIAQFNPLVKILFLTGYS